MTYMSSAGHTKDGEPSLDIPVMSVPTQLSLPTRKEISYTWLTESEYAEYVYTHHVTLATSYTYIKS